MNQTITPGADGPTRILIVEDSPDDALLMARVLESGLPGAVLVTNARNAVVLTALLFEPWHCIVCDYFIPSLPWPEAWRLAQAAQPDTPFVVISGVMKDDRGKAAFTEGIDAYLTKSELDRLPAVVALAIDERGAQAARRDATQALQKKTGTGPLTKD